MLFSTELMDAHWNSLLSKADSNSRARWIRSLRRSRAGCNCFGRVAPNSMGAAHGLGWQVEHFLVYFGATLILCAAWPRPFVVAGSLIMFSALLEALQGATPDRVPDLTATLRGAGGALSARCWPSSSTKQEPLRQGDRPKKGDAARNIEPVVISEPRWTARAW